MLSYTVTSSSPGCHRDIAPSLHTPQQLIVWRKVGVHVFLSILLVVCSLCAHKGPENYLIRFQKGSSRNASVIWGDFSTPFPRNQLRFKTKNALTEQEMWGKFNLNEWDLDWIVCTCRYGRQGRFYCSARAAHLPVLLFLGSQSSTLFSDLSSNTKNNLSPSLSSISWFLSPISILNSTVRLKPLARSHHLKRMACLADQSNSCNQPMLSSFTEDPKTNSWNDAHSFSSVTISLLPGLLLQQCQCLKSPSKSTHL